METAEVSKLSFLQKKESELTMCGCDRNDIAEFVFRKCTLDRTSFVKYSKLIHTVDHLEGILNNDSDAVDAILLTCGLVQ